MRFLVSFSHRLASASASFHRGAALIACVGSALLAGCAGTQPPKQTSSIEWERYSSGYDWKSANDPIGALVAKLRGGASYSAGEINNPLAAQALSQLGIRYRFGGKSPATGFDCSGLVGYSAQQSLGLKLPPRADDLQVGDLVFFNTMGKRYSHVGVYIGDSKFVHSPARGGVVRIEDMNERYWTTRFTGARRLDTTELANSR